MRPIKHTACLHLLLSLMLTMCFTTATAKKQKEALIAFDSLSIDVGTVYMDSPVHTYKIPYKNIGKSPFVISKVETSCECTLVDFSSASLKTEKSDTLTVHLDMSPFKVRGPFLKEITVFSNSSEGDVELIFKGYLDYERKKDE